MKLRQRSSSLRVSVTPKSFLAAALTVGFAFSSVDVPGLVAAPGHASRIKQDPALKGLPITDLTADEAIAHALNRLAYGPRPGDIERIRQMGLSKWIDQQLNPSTIDDRAMQARLDHFPTLSLSTPQLIADYPQPKPAANALNAQKPALTQPQARDRSADAAALESNSVAATNTVTNPPASMKQAPSAANALTRAASKRDVLGGPDPNAVPPAIADDSHRPQRVVEELAMAKVTQAVYSERQLQQVMDDFWFNHFNVFAGKGEDKWYLTAYERDVLQPHALGKFKDLLSATAQSPAMLFYLDNFLSADPRAAQRAFADRLARQHPRRGRFGQPWPPRPAPATQPPNKKKQERGLNENYGRELMELHTLGVDGGYTQKDVTEVARCFTGWTIDKPREFPQFKFDERLHDPDIKIVLGKKIHAGGIKDGEQVIDLLAHHPSTAKFISTKLARRFVSDDPPPSLVQHMTRTFQSTDGDIRAVLHTMVYSPEFWSRAALRSKVKTPYELVVSSARALGADVDTPMPLVQWVARIGEPLYQCQPPTGYSDKADAWVNTGALLNRLNFSLTLAGNKIRGTRSDIPSLLGADATAAAKTALDRAVQVFLGGQIAPNTVATLESQLDNAQVKQAKLDDPVKQVDLGVVTGLVLGAPEFQRR